MIRNDYLMRLIEKLSQAFFNLVAGKSATPDETTASDVERLLSESLNANPMFLFSHLDAVLDDCDPRLAFELMRLLKLHAESTSSSKAEKSFHYAAKFAVLARGSQNEEAALDALRDLHTRIDLDAEMLEALMDDELSHGRIATAENLLFEILDVEATPERIERANAFFDRLEILDDDALARGNFSKAEINEGRQSLNAWVAK